MRRPQLLISLHDATPFHLPRLLKAEAVFRDLGLQKVSYLFVPEYHGRYPSAEYPDFVQWCRASRPFQVDWFLHGFRHLESPGSGTGSLLDGLKRRTLTAGEGEFLSLDAEAQRQRLEAGRSVFRRCLQAEPEGFVAPAWLFNSSLPPLLKEMGFRYTENQRRIWRLDSGAGIPSPVITWATRTPLRKYGSLLACPALAKLWAGRPVLRVAVHPFDFDHPETVGNIRKVLGSLLPRREQAFCRDVNFDAPGARDVHA